MVLNLQKSFYGIPKFIEYYRNRNNLNFDHLDDIDVFINFFKNSFGKKLG